MYYVCYGNTRRSNGNNLFHYCLNEHVNGIGTGNQTKLSSIPRPVLTVLEGSVNEMVLFCWPRREDGNNPGAWLARCVFNVYPMVNNFRAFQLPYLLRPVINRLGTKNYSPDNHRVA
jgi:hypothetical protein